MKKIKVLLILLLGVSTMGISQSEQSFKELDKELKALLEATEASGFSVAVVKGDKTIYSKGFGYKNKELKQPMDANTLLPIGSSTKAFTTSILGKLRDDKKLTFYDNPRKHVKDLEFYNDELNNNVNIKDLITHRTGLPRHDLSWYFFSSDNKDELIQRIKYLEPVTGLRQSWNYNNFMYLVQGVIAERLTDTSWEDNVRQHLLSPLGMNRSTLTLNEFKKDHNISVGYGESGEIVDYYDISGMAPAGSINSSANEMANWLKMWLNKGQYNGNQVLPENYIREAMSAHSVVSGGLPNEKTPDIHGKSYGYGWFMQSYKGHYLVEHGGNIDGFSASVGFYPTDSIGIVVLANQNASSVPSLARNIISDFILQEKKTEWIDLYLEQKSKQNTTEDDKVETKKSSQSIIPHPLKDYEGTYNNSGYGRFRVLEQGGDLYIDLQNQLRLKLLHVHYDVFKLDAPQSDLGLESSRLNFNTNSEGDITGVNVGLEAALDHPILFKKEIEVIDVSADKLKIYEGDYDIGGVAIKFKIKKGKLTAIVPGQPEYELLPSGEHKFVIKGVDGYSTEFDVKDNKPTKVKIIQPNGTFEAKKVK